MKASQHYNTRPPIKGIRIAAGFQQRKEQPGKICWPENPGYPRNTAIACDVFTPNYLSLFSIKLCMRGVSITSIAKLILPPGTTMVLERDMNESWIMFRK